MDNDLASNLVDPDGGVNITSPTKAIATILQYNAIEWESRIVEKYEQLSGNSVSKSGFVISTHHPFFGA